MSLEATIAENTKAIQTLIETIKASDAQRGEITAKIDTLAKTPAAAKATKAKAEAAPAPEPAPEPEARAISVTPEDRKDPAAEDGPSAAVLAAQEGIAGFIGIATSDEDRKARRAAVTALIDTLGGRRTPPVAAGTLKSKDLTDAEATRFVEVGLPNLRKKMPDPVAAAPEEDDSDI